MRLCRGSSTGSTYGVKKKKYFPGSNLRSFLEKLIIPGFWAGISQHFEVQKHTCKRRCVAVCKGCGVEIPSRTRARAGARVKFYFFSWFICEGLHLE